MVNTLSTNPWQQPEIEVQVIFAQREAVKRLATLEQEYLYQQLWADSRRQEMPLPLSLAKQNWNRAQVAVTAWTRAAQLLLQWPADQQVAPTAQEDWQLEMPELPLLHESGQPTTEDVFEVQDYWDGCGLSSNELGAVLEVFELFEAGKKLTWRQQAQKFALYLQEEYHWYGGEEIVTTALDRPRWGQLARSIEKQVKLGTTPEELAFALELRGLYQEQLELHVLPQHSHAGQRFSVPSLRWSTAMRITKTFAGHDVRDIFERLLSVCRECQNPYDYVCWAERLDAILEGYPEGLDADYWLSCLERGLL